jgi:hypothetical protein
MKDLRTFLAEKQRERERARTTQPLAMLPEAPEPAAVRAVEAGAPGRSRVTSGSQRPFAIDNAAMGYGFRR